VYQNTPSTVPSYPAAIWQPGKKGTKIFLFLEQRHMEIRKVLAQYIEKCLLAQAHEKLFLVSDACGIQEHLLPAN
jgi:hypothetical protein